MMRQIFEKRTPLQRLARLTSINKCTNFLRSSSARLFSTSLSSSEELENLPNEDTPWLMLKPEIDKSTGDVLERFYSPGENRFVKLNRNKCLKVPNSARCVASTLGGWLGYIDAFDCSVYLSNPYLNQVVQLPSLTTLPCVLDFKRDPATGAIFGIKRAGYYEHYRNRDYQVPWIVPKYSCNGERVITRMLSSMAMSPSSTSQPPVVLAMQGADIWRLTYCALNPGSEWLPLQEDFNPGYHYDQLVYSTSRNLFFSLSAVSGILGYDLENDRKKRSKIVIDFPWRIIQNQLNKYNADLEKFEDVDGFMKSVHYYLVCHGKGLPLLLRRLIQRRLFVEEHDVPYKTLHFDVFHVDLEKQTLRRLEDLRDLSLFVGMNQCFSMKVTGMPGKKPDGIRPNCVYFCDDLSDLTSENWGYDHGIFDLSENRVLPLGYEDDCERVPFSDDYSQFWVAPRLLFN